MTRLSVSISESQNWTVGDRIVHKTFGVGEITHVLAQEIKSPSDYPNLGQKIIDPKIAQLQRVG